MENLIIRRLRESKGYSQEYVAEKLGVDQSVYSRWASHPKHLSLDRLERIAEVLECSVDDLLGRSPIQSELVRKTNSGDTDHDANFIDPSVTNDLIKRLITVSEERARLLEQIAERLLDLFVRSKNKP